VAYALYKRTGERGRLVQAVEAYRAARAAWVDVIEQGRAYRDDITVGGEPWLRGHWSDRLAAIDDDLGDMETELASTPTGPARASERSGRHERATASLTRAPGGQEVATQTVASRDDTPPLADLDVLPPAAEYEHIPPTMFQPGQPLTIEIGVRLSEGGRPSVLLHYRHLNQAEAYEVVEMESDDGRFRATVPAAYTDSKYPLLYFFEIRSGSLVAWLYPGLRDDLANRPYFVVRQASAVRGD
jgi:hypothetical protein